MRENNNPVNNIFGSYINTTRELTWLPETEEKRASQQDLFEVIDDYVEQA